MKIIPPVMLALALASLACGESSPDVMSPEDAIHSEASRNAAPDEPSAPDHPPTSGDGAQGDGSLELVRLEGWIEDMEGLPVSGTVDFMTLGRRTGYTARFENGTYAIDVPRSALTDPEGAWSTLLMFHPDRDDRVPLGSPEGDPVHVMPVTIAEFAHRSELAESDVVRLRDVHVPLQGRAYALPEGVLDEAFEMRWPLSHDTLGALTVTLRAEAGTEVRYPEGVRHAVTLTEVMPMLTPMRCDPNEAGEDTACLLWTLQPTGTTFDPPLSVSITGSTGYLFGDAPPEVGERFPMRIASPLGWRAVGEAEVRSVDERHIDFTSIGGVIDQAGWGHVIGNTLLQGAGIITLETCAGVAYEGKVQPHPIISRDQPDYVHWDDIYIDSTSQGGSVRLVCDRRVRAVIDLLVESVDGRRTVEHIEVECAPGERTYAAFIFDTTIMQECR